MPLPLGPLASTIIEELPALIERTLRHDVENNVLDNQCADLNVHIGIVKKNISDERDEQRHLREKIAEIRSFKRRRNSSLSLMSMYQFEDSITSVSDVQSQYSESSYSPVFSDSPVSLRTKRKGIVFGDEVRIPKKAKLDKPVVDTQSVDAVHC